MIGWLPIAAMIHCLTLCQRCSIRLPEAAIY